MLCTSYNLQFQVDKESIQPKALRPESFEWDRSDLTRVFRGAGTDPKKFCQIWDEQLQPNLNDDGTFDLDAALSAKEGRTGISDSIVYVICIQPISEMC